MRPGGIALEESLVGIDIERRIAKTTRREIRFERLVSSAPFHKFVQMTGLSHDASAFTVKLAPGPPTALAN